MRDPGEGEGVIVKYIVLNKYNRTNQIRQGVVKCHQHGTEQKKIG